MALTDPPMTIDLRAVPDEDLHREFLRRADVERNFAWAVSLVRDYAVWESESGRARKVTEWHARQISERLCDVLGISREDFSRRVIQAART